MLNQMLIFLLDTLLGLFSLALLLRFYMQLLRAPYRNPLSQFLIQVTDFMVKPGPADNSQLSRHGSSHSAAGVACAIVAAGRSTHAPGLQLQLDHWYRDWRSRSARPGGDHQDDTLHCARSCNHAGRPFLVQSIQPASSDT